MATFFSGIFGNKEKEKKDIKEADVVATPTEQFSIVQAEKEGKRLVGSINKSYKTFDKKSEFPWCLYIGIALEPDSLQENGLPGVNENKIATRQEDILMEGIKKIETVQYIGHFLLNGFLDIYVYLPTPEKVHEFLQEQINSGNHLRDFRYEMKQDPQWEIVNPLLGDLL